MSPEEISQNDVRVVRMAFQDLEFYRFLYGSIGAPWRWKQRLVMPREELHRILSDPNTTVNVLYYQGVPAGYFELVKGAPDETKQPPETGGPEFGTASVPTDPNSILLAYFGIRPLFVGKGLGKHLLSCAIQEAWARNPSRVWVHTCNMDSPHALLNYKARGFEPYHTKEEPTPDLYKDRLTDSHTTNCNTLASGKRFVLGFCHVYMFYFSVLILFFLFLTLYSFRKHSL